jgi:hypothetical protein
MDVKVKVMDGHLIVYALIDKGESVSEAACLYPRPGEMYLYHIKTPKKTNKKRGYASKVLEAIQKDPRVGIIITGWSQSTPEGRALCKKNGFKREKDWLIWKNEKKLKEIYENVQNIIRQNSSQAAPGPDQIQPPGTPTPQTGHEQNLPRSSDSQSRGESKIVIAKR